VALVPAAPVPSIAGVALEAVGTVGVPETCEYATWEQLAVPDAVTPVAYCPLVHCAGADAKAVAVAALPVVLPVLLMSVPPGIVVV
jgi:hypothetical protein